jgi:hypothetical protein
LAPLHTSDEGLMFGNPDREDYMYKCGIARHGLSETSIPNIYTSRYLRLYVLYNLYKNTILQVKSLYILNNCARKTFF